MLFFGAANQSETNKVGLRRLRLRTKILLGFLVIVAINASAGVLNLWVIGHLGELVNLTYDKALMTGNFAQAAKYDFVKADAEIMSALLSRNVAELRAHANNAQKISETLLEDLQVVTDRALSQKSAGYVSEINKMIEPLEVLKKELLARREKELLSNRADPDPALSMRWATGATKSLIEDTLTRLYDDAAETGYRFRLDSEIKNKRNLQITTWVLVGGSLLSLLLATVLSFSLLRPLKVLLEACRKIEAGEYKTRAEIKARDEFGSLGRAFDSMLDKIEARDNEMSSLLSALPFGVFYFDRTGEISRQRSKSTDAIFKNFRSYSNIKSFLHELKGTEESRVQETLGIVVDELLPFESAVELLPARISIPKDSASKMIDLTYRAQRGANEKVERVIVIAEDVSEKILAFKESERQAARVKRIASASQDMTGYREFLPEAEALFDSALSALKSTERLDEAKRDLHSIKGLLGLYDLKEPALMIHELENALASASTDARDESMIGQLVDRLSGAKKLFSTQSDEVSQILGMTRSQTLRQYDSRKISKLQETASSQANAEMLSLLLTLDEFPITKVMAKYGPFCERLAEKLGDKIVVVEFAEDSCELSYAEAQRLDASLVHLFRNCVDHGIESCQARVDAGKSEAGTIVLKTERLTDGMLRMTISDNGGGIDAERLSAKAVKTGYWTEAKAQTASFTEKIELIFAAGLSTKAEATEISGRGVGMDAVRAQLESLGGRILVETKKAIGTQFTLELPARSSASSAQDKTKDAA
jgi:HAMP domain-containing protein/HPt (histidine-containing phosphotransfer) domain-containing protein